MKTIYRSRWLMRGLHLLLAALMVASMVLPAFAADSTAGEITDVGINLAAYHEPGVIEQTGLNVEAGKVDMVGASISQSAEGGFHPPDPDTTKSYWTFNSSDESVATVKELITTPEITSAKACTLEIKGIKEGSATVTVDLKFTYIGQDGNERELLATKSFKVNVTAPTPTAPTGISVTPELLTLDPGKSDELRAALTPADTGEEMKWSSADETIAGVVKNSVFSATVNAKKPGKTKVTVTAAGFSAESEIVVKGVTLSPETLSLRQTETRTLTPTIFGGIGTDYTWESSDPNVATVSGGTVRAVSPGTARISVYVRNTDYRAECSVSVSETKAEVISASADNARPLKFDSIANSIDEQCRRVLGSSLRYVTGLSVPTSSGLLMYGYDSAERPGEGVGSGQSFYYTQTTGQRLLSNITFVSNDSFAGSTTIDYTGYASDGKSFKGTIEVSIQKTGDVSYSVSARQPVHFAASDFNKICLDRRSRDLDHVRFSLPSSARGTLYYNYSGNTSYDSKVSADTDYYRTTGPSLDKVTFVPADDFTGEVTISYTGYDAGNASYSGRVTITVSGSGGSGDISYTVGSNGYARFDSDKFNTFCKNMTTRSLDRVRFTLPSTSEGRLYYNYRSSDSYDHTVSSSSDYYRSSSYYLSNIYFVPASDYSGTSTISFTAYDTSGERITGIVSVKVDEGTVGDVRYTCAEDSYITFSASDFNEVSRDRNNYNLDYVRFTDLPSSSRGKLYYKYKSSSGGYDHSVSTSSNYYRSSSYYLDDVAFVAADDYTGTVSLDFTGYDTNGGRFTGTVSIRVGSGKDGDISYSVNKNSYVTFKASDFNDASRDHNSNNLNYVRFDLPSSSRGTLYYKYKSSGDYDSKVSSSTSYYRSSSRYLDDVSFVPDKDYTGNVEIEYTGYDTNGGRFTGKVNIRVGTGTSTDRQISYKCVQGRYVNLSADDFNNASQDHNGKNLNYVRFELPSSNQGTLYYKYTSSGKYDSKVSPTKNYYRSSSSYLQDVTFVPASGYVGTATFSYTGYDSSGSKFTGKVNVSVQSTVAQPVRYSSTGGAVTFKDSDFNNVCRILMDENMSKVSFTPPSTSQGRLYVGYVAPNQYQGLVSSSSEYYYLKSPNIASVTFVPANGYSGTVSIPYSGQNASGYSYTGTVEIAVQYSATSRFSDMGEFNWAVPAVEYLYANDVVKGVSANAFGPNRSTSRGDFTLMIVRAFKFPQPSGSAGFSDVPTGSYYAQAIATARGLGIVEGSGGRFSPEASVSRQDAMLMLQRAMRASGWVIEDGNSADLLGFTDVSSIDSYAAGAVGAMARLGIVKGDERARMNPRAAINRAEMAVILHRALIL